MKIHIGVLGPHSTTDEQYQLGVEAGRYIAEAGALLFCGGLEGMMRAAAEGAKSAGGQTVGILPGIDKSAANEFIDIAIPKFWLVGRAMKNNLIPDIEFVQKVLDRNMVVQLRRIWPAGNIKF